MRGISTFFSKISPVREHEREPWLSETREPCFILTGCSEGFMLVLAPYADFSPETAAKRITRAQCLNLNEYAADLANVTL